MHQGVIYALLAAALFGASTPFAKALLGDIHPIVLAGLLYAGSGAGLAIVQLLRFSFIQRKEPMAWPSRGDWGWLAAGGVLSVGPGHVGGVSRGALLVAAACLCWAIDNNLTRKVSASDAILTAGLKGLVAGVVNLSVALGLGYALPSLPSIAQAASVGFFGYGLSLALFVLALRHLGTARTGAYFAIAPFFGGILAVLFFGDAVTLQLCIAAALMGVGLWLHLSERHEHEHAHDAVEHVHMHRHDVHHRHVHDFQWDGVEPHTHPHRHEAMVHKHVHFPDVHHRHRHGSS